MKTYISVDRNTAVIMQNGMEIDRASGRHSKTAMRARHGLTPDRGQADEYEPPTGLETLPEVQIDCRPTHTPGPWKAQGSQIIQAGDREAWQFKIATLPTTVDPKPTLDAASKSIEERDANAKLIASAPDLLAALEKMIPHVLHYASMPAAASDAHRDTAAARAAIKKAKEGK